MCYYNAINITKASSVQLGAIKQPILQPGQLHIPLQSGFDYATYPVLKKKEGLHDFEIAMMEWGFLPPYIKTRAESERFRKGYKDDKGVFHPPITTLNAIAEEILLPRKIFRKSALERRCLVLSSGFYEWRHHHGINKKTGQPLKTAIKYPYFIHLKDREYFFMAGVWQPWEDQETGEYAETFAVLTTASNSLLSQVHNSKLRMPLILSDDLAEEWLLGNPDEERIHEISTYQYPSGNMEAFTIAKDFREAHDPMRPVHYEELPDLKF